MITRADAERAVVESIVEFLPDVPDISPNQTLDMLGADSVTRAEIIAAARDRLRIGRPLSDFGGLATVSTLIDQLSDLPV